MRLREVCFRFANDGTVVFVPVGLDHDAQLVQHRLDVGLGGRLIPALAEFRKATAERIQAGQLAGTVRTDIDPVTIGNGIVSILLSLLMSVVQVGGDVALAYRADVAAVFEAALDVTPPPAVPKPRRGS